MSWSSRTGHFNSQEISELENTSIEDLTRRILNSDPLVVLRCFAEMKLNSGSKKLHKLLLNKELRNRWRDYETDEQADACDNHYAFSLERFIKTRGLG